jgi:guanosine-3',5'-bis(diphosphate) 3'-pyrophosphohydrolase
MTDQRSRFDWQQAASFAARAHDGQHRKDGVTPYVAHPYRVAMTVRHVFGIDDEVALVAALLHDTIEDTTTDYDELLETFGREVADAVAALSKDMRLPEHLREPAYDKQLAAASWQARAVKLGDVFDNYCDSATEAKRKAVVDKVRRAIACAGDDKRLAPAIAAVTELIGDASLPG